MTPEKQRIAIAETLGWENIWYSDNLGESVLSGTHPQLRIQQAVPDYLNDLNAMHEAEKSNEMHYNQKWCETIVAIALRESAVDFQKTDGWDWVLLVSRMSSAQRAEAFLRTIGKWEDGE